MAKEETTRKITLTVADGVRFGVGFFIVGIVGMVTVIAVASVIVLAARYFGLAF